MATLADYELGTLPGLWKDFDRAREHGFSASSRADAEAWQAHLREHVRAALGRMPAEAPDHAPARIESVEDDGFTRDLIVLQVQPGEYMPVYVLTPHNAAASHKPVIALHGHGSWGAALIVGIANSPTEAETLRRYNYDYARKIAQMGYKVFAPVVRGFAERMESTERQMLNDDPTLDGLSSCARVSLNALLAGQTLMGLRVWDTMRLVDYVKALPDVAPDGLACVGLSGGGTLTMYAAALDERITCAYSSGAVNTFRDSIMTIEHCLCNYVPGVTDHAEMPEIAGLIAPRPLVIEGGTDDPIYPAHGFQRAAETLRQIYAAFGMPERFAAHSFTGEHRWDGAPVQAWLERCL